MDFNREWTQFALDAEVDAYGTGRIAKAHNALRQQCAEKDAEIVRLKSLVDMSICFHTPNNECIMRYAYIGRDYDDGFHHTFDIMRPRDKNKRIEEAWNAGDVQWFHERPESGSYGWFYMAPDELFRTQYNTAEEALFALDTFRSLSALEGSE